MKTAHEIAHDYLRWAAPALHCNGDVESGPDEDGNHNPACDLLTAAIEARVRETVEACAKAALTAKAHAGDCDCQFCSYLLRGIAAIRSLSPKGTT